MNENTQTTARREGNFKKLGRLVGTSADRTIAVVDGLGATAVNVTDTTAILTRGISDLSKIFVNGTVENIIGDFVIDQIETSQETSQALVKANLKQEDYDAMRSKLLRG